MKHRPFGKSGRKVSEIGFGAWGIGKSWWGPTDDAESLRALKAALEAGIDLFDTAYVYGDGHSEELIAKALGRSRGKVFLATKCPPKDLLWGPKPDKDIGVSFPEDWIVQATERSLKKLATDCVDLQQLHCWTDGWANREEWRKAVDKLKRQGKIRFFGVSINDREPNSVLKLVASGQVDAVQVIYNIFEQAPADKLFPLCEKMNVAVIVRVPFDEGSLTGMLTSQTRFEPEDFRSNYFAGRRLAETCERVEKLKALLGPYAPTLPLLALKFVLAHPAVSVVIPGMRKSKHVGENIKASDGALPRPTLAALKKHAWQRSA